MPVSLFGLSLQTQFDCVLQWRQSIIYKRPCFKKPVSYAEARHNMEHYLGPAVFYSDTQTLSAWPSFPCNMELRKSRQGHVARLYVCGSKILCLVYLFTRVTIYLHDSVSVYIFRLSVLMLIELPCRIYLDVNTVSFARVLSHPLLGMKAPFRYPSCRIW